jgi:F-type H+-transporting ATPase subunit delta
MSVSKSYAKALLESAKEMGLQSSDLDQIQSELDSFRQAMDENAEFNEALTSPVVSAQNKVEISSAVASKMGFSKLTNQFVALVARKGRADIFEEISDAFMEVRLEAEGATLGTVVSADVLQKADLEELAAAFSKKTGKKTIFKAEVDPSLLAGLKVTVSGVTYDGSLRSQLQQLRNQLVYGTA